MRLPTRVSVSTLLLAAGLGLGCDGSPTAPSNADALRGRWVGALPPHPWFLDETRLTFTLSGESVTGTGGRGVPCPTDGQCWRDVYVSGTYRARVLAFVFIEEWGDGDRFEGQLEGEDRIVGTLHQTGELLKPLTLRRVEP